MYYYICSVCNKEFSTDMHSRKYCSHKCHDEWRKGLKDTWIYQGTKYRIGQRKDGYIYISDFNHPNAHDGWLKRSRWIMSKLLNRSLLDSEIIDHINGIKTEDTLKNLRILDAISHGEIGYNPGRFQSGKRGVTPEWIRERISEGKNINPWKPTEEQLKKMKEKRNSFLKEIICCECGMKSMKKAAIAKFCSKKCSKRFHKKLQIKQM